MNRLRKFLAAVRDDLSQGENLDAYVLFVVGVFFAVLGLLGVVDQNILGAVILATLSLLVVGDVISRHNSRELRQIMTAKQSASITCPLKTFTVLDESVAQRVSQAQTILLLGISLHRSVPVQRDRIGRALAAGGRLRLLVSNPDNAGVMEMASVFTEDGVTAETHRQRVLSTIDEARNFKRRYPGADVELRTVDFVPPFGLTLIVPKDGLAETWCHVRLQGFRKAITESPVINPDPILHEDLLRYYREQFDWMWLSANVVAIDSAP